MIDPHYHPSRKALDATIGTVLEMRERGVEVGDAGEEAVLRIDQAAFG